MSEYSLEFSEKLIEAAELVAKIDLEEIESKRTVLYLSLLSCEITIKALLEKAGYSVKTIKLHSHKLSALLKEIGICEIYKDVTPGCKKWIRATEIRSITIDYRFSNATAGNLLTGEKSGASIYPNQIRYGDKLAHYPPEVMLEVAKAIVDWAKIYWGKIRIAQPGATH
jgi:hypothetical protein